jgi:CubicO group peptidase (beta-lactamase class C family)
MTITALPHTPLLADRCGSFLADIGDLVGYQLHVIHRGEVVVDACHGIDGLDRPLAPDSLFAVYCATKPVAAVVAAELAAEGVLSFDDRLCDHLGHASETFEHVHLRHLLAHSAGLHGYRAQDYLMLPPDARRLAALHSRPHPDWPIGERSAYGEYVPWFLLGLVLERVTGQPFATLVREHVARPLGLQRDLFVGVPIDLYDIIRDRLRVGIDVTFERPVPMLLEVGRRFVTEPNPASVGGLASARGLAGFYQALLEIGAGRSTLPIDADALSALLTEQTPRGPDPVLDRAAGFGLGFMVDLAAHDFGVRCSPASFGHGGFAANAWAFADPEHDLVVAYVQSARFAADRAIFGLREPLVDLIYDTLIPAAR